ncbi:polysaccharide deacetylase family protein [Desulforudis sp. 1088]|uniref:polysaccharide deacetylase family protein n=2 Tax=Candidatus Desulforudis TaxID=471826 RepID=UPI003CE4E433
MAKLHLSFGKVLRLFLTAILVLGVSWGAGCSREPRPDVVPSPPVKEERAAQAPPELGTAPVPQGHPDGKAVVLCYHQLVTRKPLFNSELNIDDFRTQMKYLADNGYTTLSLAELKNCLAHRSFPPKSVVITFDDGYKTFYTLAYPILKEYGLKAAVFPVVSLTPGLERRVAWGEHLRFHHLRAMLEDSDLVEVGSHTYDLHYRVEQPGRSTEPPVKPPGAGSPDHGHVPSEDALEPDQDSPETPDPAGRTAHRRTPGRPAIDQAPGEDTDAYQERLYRDLRLAKDLLEAQIDREVIALSWPYGRATPATVEAGRRAGYRLFFTTARAPVTSATKADAVPRYLVQSGSLEEFKAILASASCTNQ